MFKGLSCGDRAEALSGRRPGELGDGTDALEAWLWMGPTSACSMYLHRYLHYLVSTTIGGFRLPHASWHWAVARFGLYTSNTSPFSFSTVGKDVCISTCDVESAWCVLVRTRA